MNIRIPEPCYENWDHMQPEENGRFCSACCKTVIDFTGMAPDAISAYLIRHRSQKICGRFTEKQLAAAYDVDVYQATSHIARSAWPLMKKMAAIFVLLFALSQAGNAQTPRKTLPNVIVTNNTTRTGIIVAASPPTPLPPLLPVQCATIKTGGVFIPPQSKRAKRKLKRLQKAERKKQEVRSQQAGEVVVIAGMVRAD